MSPEERIGEVIRKELQRIETVVAELASWANRVTPGCEHGARMGLAAYLHSFYTGCEMVLGRLVQARQPPKGEAWHTTLLVHAAAPVEGVRPPIISTQTVELLVDLLRFRHFFRHAYGVELDVEKLQQHAASVPEAWRAFRTDIEAFLRLLEVYP